MNYKVTLFSVDSFLTGPDRMLGFQQLVEKHLNTEKPIGYHLKQITPRFSDSRSLLVTWERDE